MVGGNERRVGPQQVVLEVAEGTLHLAPRAADGDELRQTLGAVGVAAAEDARLIVVLRPVLVVTYRALQYLHETREGRER